MHLKFKGRQSYSVVIEIRIVFTSEKGHREAFRVILYKLI